MYQHDQFYYPGEEPVAHAEASDHARRYPGRGESLAMLLVTGIYLVFELAFAARLLDVVGTTLDRYFKHDHS